MCPFRHVEDNRAGPSALGILTPPGKRTVLILRPRSLSWDLLLVQTDSTHAFRELPRAEASRLAQELFQSLCQWSNGASGYIEEMGCPDGDGYWLRVRVGTFALLLCGRHPGQPYRPLTFPDSDTALKAAAELRGILRPAAHIEQEVYLNTTHFAR
jgi:hypothetical protein